MVIDRDERQKDRAVNQAKYQAELEIQRLTLVQRKAEYEASIARDREDRKEREREKEAERVDRRAMLEADREERKTTQIRQLEFQRCAAQLGSDSLLAAYAVPWTQRNSPRTPSQRAPEGVCCRNAHCARGASACSKQWTTRGREGLWSIERERRAVGSRSLPFRCGGLRYPCSYACTVASDLGARRMKILAERGRREAEVLRRLIVPGDARVAVGQENADCV